MLSREVKDLLRFYSTPIYLYDTTLLQNTLEVLQKEAGRYGFLVHYAMKANSNPRLLRIIAQYGLGIDAVSGNEIERAIESGFPAEKIVFAGVGKRDEELRLGIEKKILAFNCESLQEIEIIDKISGELGERTDIALRINPDVDPRTHRLITTGTADDKFGIAQREIDRLLASLDSFHHIRIIGLHFHIGSQITDMAVFKELCLRVNDIYRWFEEQGIRPAHLDLGGGLGIDYGHPDSNSIPDFRSYFATFAENLQVDPDIRIHFELGRAIVAQCGELITRVLFTKTTESGRRLAIVDASMTELIRPALYDARHALENLSGGEEYDTYDVVGTVCESSDTFARDLRLPVLKRGDIISIKSTGAYGEAMASQYNMHPLPEAIYSDLIKSETGVSEEISR